MVLGLYPPVRHRHSTMVIILLATQMSRHTLTLYLYQGVNTYLPVYLMAHPQQHSDIFLESIQIRQVVARQGLCIIHMFSR